MGPHHSDMPEDSPLRRQIQEQFRQQGEARISAFNNMLREAIRQPLLGATGTHPEGKLTPQDDGAIQFAVGVADGKVVLDFGTPVTWLGMPPGDALKLAESLIQRARQAAKATGTILTLNI